MDDTAKLLAHCEEKLDLKNAKLAEEFFYESLPLAIIDAVFSINSKYKSALNAVEKYKIAFAADDKHTLSALIEAFEKAASINEFADKYLNRQKAPGRGSPLKAENTYKWALILRNHGIETPADFKNKMNKAIDKELMEVKGQGGTGAALKYLYMLCGDENTSKPDTHLLRFLSDALGRNVRADEAQALMQEAAKQLFELYPHMTVRLLDNTIWKYQSQLSQKTKTQSTKRICK